MKREDFIGQYLDKKMKNHNLPMGMAYYSKLSKHTEEAEKKFKKESEKIDIVVIEFHGLNDLWYHKRHWDEIGGYRGFLKEMAMSIRNVASVKHKRVHPRLFPSSEWEG